MSKLTQMNIHVPEKIIKIVEDRSSDFGCSRRALVMKALETLDDLLKRHEETAEKAAEIDVGDLFRRLSRLMFVGLMRAKVEWARFSDGRPALIVDEEWVVAEAPATGDLVAIGREDGRPGLITRDGIREVEIDEQAIATTAALN